MDIEIPGYQLLRTIGKGGMATVFLAKQKVLERKVALKIMSKSLAEEPAFGERFMREARIVSQLVHPNIVTVHEVGQHEGRYFLSMEYIDGHDLRKVGKNLDILGKIRVIEDIARALHYAGEKGYVHRDIKPENIMFRSADGSAVLTDFGIAKAVKTDLSMTQTGTAIGTPHYMSPEQAKGKDVDHRSDLYSLGVVFYQLLTGKVPYDAETAVAIGIKHITDPIPTLPPEYAPLQPILDGLLAKSVVNRYQSGLALLNDLRTINLHELQESEEANHHNTGDADALTVLSGAEYIEDEPNDTDRFTIEFSTSDTVERPPAAIWPGLAAALFIVGVIAFGVYLARPPLLEPWIARFENKVSTGQQKVKNKLRESQHYVEERAKNYLATDQETITEKPDSPKISEPVAPSAFSEPRNAEEPDSVENSKIEPQSLATLTNDVDASPDIQPPDLPSLAELTTELDSLEEKLKSGPEVLADYVAKLYEVIALYPDNLSARQTLESLTEESEAAIFQEAKRGRASELEALLKQHKRVFNNEPASLRAERAQRARNISKRESLMALAKQQLAVKRVSIPEGDNAVATLHKVLTVKQDDPEALSLLKDVSRAYIQEAQKAFAVNDLKKAETAVDRALIAIPGQEDAARLAEEIRSEQNRVAAIQRHLNQAGAYSEHGFLYAPDGANAYDEYQAVLTLDSTNEVAQKGISELMDKLSVLVWQYVGDARFSDASDLLARPMALMPENERLLAMQAAIEEVAP